MYLQGEIDFRRVIAYLFGRVVRDIALLRLQLLGQNLDKFLLVDYLSVELRYMRLLTLILDVRALLGQKPHYFFQARFIQRWQILKHLNALVEFVHELVVKY